MFANASPSQVRGVTAQDVRNRVVEEMRGDWASYEPFVDHALHPDYLANMARSTEYAGEPELVALSKVYGVTIRVWGADETHDRDIRAPRVGADAPVVHLAHRDARNFRDLFFAVQLSPRGDYEVHSQPIMQRMRGAFRTVLQLFTDDACRRRSVRSWLMGMQHTPMALM